jgi:hypothetical protein
MRRLFFIVLTTLAASCALEPLPADPPEPSRAAFDTAVYPVLVRDCGFPACHGDSNRFFRVFSPGRTRLDEATGLSVQATTAELDATYARARSMLSSAPSPERSLLLRKPLEVDQGGAPHMGIDMHGRDVYANTEAQGYVALLEWAQAGDGFASVVDDPEPEEEEAVP